MAGTEESGQTSKWHVAKRLGSTQEIARRAKGRKSKGKKGKGRGELHVENRQWHGRTLLRTFQRHGLLSKKAAAKKAANEKLQKGQLPQLLPQLLIIQLQRFLSLLGWRLSRLPTEYCCSLEIISHHNICMPTLSKVVLH